MSDRYRRSEYIEGDQKLHLVPPDKPNRDEQTADEAAVEDESSSPDLKEYQRILKEFGPLTYEDMKNSGSNDRRHEDVEYKIERFGRALPQSFTLVNRPDNSKDEAGRDKDTVGVNRDPTKERNFE